MQFVRKSLGIALILIVLISLSVFATGQSESTSDAVVEEGVETPITVFTSILPQQYFVEKIGGDRVAVQVLVGPGESPATYEPTPQQVTLLASAEVLFAIGVPFERAFLPTIESNLSSLEIVDTSEGVERRILEGTESTQDPHIWMAPAAVKIQAGNIYEALVELDPAGEETYTAGYDALIAELDEVDAELAAALTPFEGNTLFVFHPAFGYFGDSYGLKQAAIETGGKEPSPAALEELIENAKAENVHIIFVQPEFSQNSAAAIAEAIDGAVVSLAPLNPDYIDNLRHIAEEVEKSFE